VATVIALVMRVNPADNETAALPAADPAART
jgi:hypothetical protein